MWLFRWVHVFLLNQIVPPALYFIQPKTKNQSRVQRIDKHVVNALSLTHTETCSSTYSLDRVVHTCTSFEATCKLSKIIQLLIIITN